MAWWNWPFGGIGKKVGDALQDTEVRPTVVQEPAYYPKLRETIGNRLQGLLDTGPEKYTGELVAPLTDEQNKSLSRLGEFDASGRPSLLGEGANEISKTLASQYDPATSAYFQAFRDQRLYDLGESKRRYSEDAAGAGRFFHGARVEGLRKLDESATRDINTENATLAERERDRRTSVLGQGLNYANAQTGFDLNRINALQNYGSLEQRQKQAEDTAAYQEELRRMSQGRSDISQASGFAGETPYAYSQFQESELMRLLKAIIPAAGSIAGRL